MSTPADDAGDVAPHSDDCEVRSGFDPDTGKSCCEVYHVWYVWGIDTLKDKVRSSVIEAMAKQRDEARAEVDSLRAEVERLTASLEEVARRLDHTEWSKEAEDRNRVALLHAQAALEGRARPLAMAEHKVDSLRVTLAAVGVDPDLVAEGVRFALKAWARKYDETSINLLTQTHLDDALVDGVLIALGQQPALDPTVIDFTDLRAILAADPVSLADVREGSES